MSFTSLTPQGETNTSPTALLDAAATRLARKLEAALPQSGELGVTDALSALQVLVTSVRAILSGEDVASATTTLLRPTLHARLIEALRSEVITPPLRPEQAQPSLTVVRALQAAREALRGEGYHDLRDRLTQPDAFELLVEVAHDLRSPLTSILFLSEALRIGHSGGVNEVQRSQLGLIYSAALGLASVASDIVDLARNGKGLVETEPEAYSLGEVFRGVVDLVGPMADEKGVELRVKVPDLEQSYGHPAALGRIVLNLTTNALKFTEQGYVEIGVTRKSRSELEFYVRDTGRGISEERQRDLFQPFKKRSERNGHYFSGSGVGLTIANRLTRALGSELLLETAPDWGTRFFFVIEAPPIQ
jgi:signal transduction histidine kinase